MDDFPALTSQFATFNIRPPLGSFAARARLCAGRRGFVAARHGILHLACRLCFWRCTAMFGRGFAHSRRSSLGDFGDLGRVGLWRAIAITLFGGLPLALWSYYGYVYVPLGHGAIIQPSCAALGGLVLSSLVLNEAAAATHFGVSRDGCSVWSSSASRRCIRSARTRLPRRHDVRRRGLLPSRSSACCCGSGAFRQCRRWR